MSQAPRPNLREHVLRPLNKIKKPSTAEQITELLNHEPGPGDRPFQSKTVATCLRHTTIRHRARIADHPISRIEEMLPWNINSATPEVST